MTEPLRETVKKFNLSTVGEDTYSSQTSQNPDTARRLLSLMPSPDGELTRELGQPKYVAGVITESGVPVKVGALYEFQYNNAGTLVQHFFCASAKTLYENLAGVWTAVTLPDALTLHNYPQFKTINNTLHMWDGTNNFIYDNAKWVVEGFPVPQNACAFKIDGAAATVNISTIVTDGNGNTTLTTAAPFTPAVGSLAVIAGVSATFNGVWKVSSSAPLIVTQPNIPAQALGAGGTIGQNGVTATVGKFYWFTYADATATRVHEGSSAITPASGGVTGALTNQAVEVIPCAGQAKSTIGSTAVPLQASDGGINISSGQVGMSLYIGGTLIGTIASVSLPAGGPFSYTLVNTALATFGAFTDYAVAPSRATNFNIYCSEVDGSKLGQFLGTIAILANATPRLIDQSPFVNQPGTIILPINRPIRNDPAPASRVGDIFKYRIFRRRETKPNFFTYSAAEEVASGNNGSPFESVPGTSVNTLSDVINETSYPKESYEIRALCAHGDALYIATRQETIPLYGDSIDNFGLSQVTAFQQGCAGRWAMVSTPHGLVFLSYDRKMYLYPTANYPWAYVPKDVNVTDQLIEIGRPLRKKLIQILASDLDNVRLQYYNYGVRDWLIVAWQDTTNAYQTWIYDFSAKSWWQSQRGFVSLGVFEPAAGQKVLVGGGADGFVYVMDDQTGAFAANTTLPAALYRPALIDFGAPEAKHVPYYIDMEVSNADLVARNSIKLNFYLDPPDADNPGQPRTAMWAKVPRSSNIYRAWFGKGVVCKRLMVEFSVAADTNAGSIRGLVLKAKLASNLGG